MGIVIPPGPSNWTYPPPIDRSFLNSYYSKLTYKETATTEPFDVLISAVANLTRIQGYKFGAEMVEVRVGDVIQPEWTGAENRSVNMYCVACNEGREVWGGIFSACNGCKWIFSSPTPCIIGRACSVRAKRCYFALGFNGRRILMEYRHRLCTPIK